MVEEKLTANERLVDLMIAHQIYLLSYARQRSRVEVAALIASDAMLKDLLLKELYEFDGFKKASDSKKFVRLRSKIVKLRSAYWDKLWSSLQSELTLFARAEPEFIRSIVTVVSPVTIEFNEVAAVALLALASNPEIHGKTVKDRIEQISINESSLILTTLQTAIVTGASISGAVKSVIGSSITKNTDGVTYKTRKYVNDLVRTSIFHTATASRSAFFEANSDVFSKEKYVATLDSKTTPLCASLDGKVYLIGEGPHPPMHINCRSLRVAFLSDVSLLARPASGFVEKQALREYSQANFNKFYPDRESLPHGHKSKYDEFRKNKIKGLVGQVPADLKYSEFLTRQPAWFQDAMLGKTKAALFRSGALTINDFIDDGGRTLTLDSLRKRYSQIFKSLGL